MPHIRPFRALRPEPSLVAVVVAVSARFTTRRAPMAWLAVLTLAAVVILALTGHAAGSASHSDHGRDLVEITLTEAVGVSVEPGAAPARRRRPVPCAGSPVERLLDASKLGKIIPPLLQYDGLCTPKPWKFLTLSIPEWSLVWFAILLVTFIVTPFLFRK